MTSRSPYPVVAIVVLALAGAALGVGLIAPVWAGSNAGSEEVPGAAVASPLASPVASPAASPAASPVAGDPVCAGAVTWAAAASNALRPSAAVFELVQTASSGGRVDPAAARAGAATLREIATQLPAIDTPSVAAPVSAQFVDALGGMADAMDALAAAAEAGDPAAQQVAANDFYVAGFALTGGAYTDLVARCPRVGD